MWGNSLSCHSSPPPVSPSRVASTHPSDLCLCNTSFRKPTLILLWSPLLSVCPHQRALTILCGLPGDVSITPAGLGPREVCLLPAVSAQPAQGLAHRWCPINACGQQDLKAALLVSVNSQPNNDKHSKSKHRDSQTSPLGGHWWPGDRLAWGGLAGLALPSSARCLPPAAAPWASSLKQVFNSGRCCQS